MEAHGTGAQYAYDRVKQALHLHTDRGSILSVVGIYGMIDRFPAQLGPPPSSI